VVLQGVEDRCSLGAESELWGRHLVRVLRMAIRSSPCAGFISARASSTAAASAPAVEVGHLGSIYFLPGVERVARW